MKRFLSTSLVALALLSGTAAFTAAHADDHNWHQYNQNEHRYNDNFSRNGHGNGNDRERAQGRATYYYAPPAPHYYPPRTKVVYVYPRIDYRPVGYYRTYTVGGYLPRDRDWYPVPTYVAQSLPAPRYGERWVYADRDAVLISEATSRIISGIVLAASIN